MPEAVADVLGALEAASVAFERHEVSPQVRDALASALRTAMAAPKEISSVSTRQILLAARAAAGNVNRMGFRRQDRADASMLAGLQAGVAAILDLMRELDRLGEVLAPKAATASVPDDRSHFLSTFEHIYSGAPKDGTTRPTSG